MNPKIKRRPFLASISALSAGAFIPLVSVAKSNEEAVKSSDQYWQGNLTTAPSILKKLENEFISFTWFSNASALIVDKKTGANWNMWPVANQEEESIERGHVWVRQDRSMCEQYPARFAGVANGDDVKFTVIGFSKKIKGDFTCSASLDKDRLTFKIKNISPQLPNLMFPPHIESEQLVLPMGVGRLIRKPLSSRNFYSFFSHLNMRWFGGLKEKSQHGWMALFGENFENGGVSASELALVPTWQKSLGKWEPVRSVQYIFTSGGYVGQAKAYRKIAKENGLFKTLEDKIKDIPALKNMVGGRIVSVVTARCADTVQMQQEQLKPLTEELKSGDGKLKVLNKFSNIPNTVAELQKAGMKRGIINIRGWGRGGYDYGHPDIWPPSPEVGTVEELKKACDMPENFIAVLHDNYQDTYEHNPSFPKGINIRANGEKLLGGYWDPGQSYIMNSKASLEFAKRNWEKIKEVAPQGMFVDTITAMQLYESYEAGNTQTRKQDLEGKLNLIKFFKQKNLIFGSEESADFGIANVDWMECRHKRIVGESIPLWPLVYHDCVMMGRYNSVNESLPEVIAKSNSHPKHLEDMLWGYFMLYWSQDSDSQMQQKAIVATTHVDDWFGQIATSEMTKHEFLSDDFMVERTTFANNKSITVNFSNVERDIENMTFKPYEYKLNG